MADWKTGLDPNARGGRYLPWKEVARATGLSRTTAWRLQKRGDFPAPYALSPGRVAYREDEVEAWRASRDHSAARARPVALPARAADVLADPAAGDGQRGARVDATLQPTAHEVAATRHPVAESAGPDAQPHAKAKASGHRAGRRRSEHAKAVAQQMRFDF